MDLFGSIARYGDKLVGALSGSVVGGTQRLDEKFKEKTHERVEETKARILDIAIIHLPIILSWDVAITEMRTRAYGFGFSAGHRNDKVVF